MLTGWAKAGGKWYYFNTSGAMQTGWQKISGKWYYFDKTTGENLTGWIKVGGKTWYCDPANGYRLTGWQTIGGKKYYFNSSGVMQKGIVKISGKRYYFESDGSLVINKSSYSINGIAYKVGTDGVLSYSSDAYALAAARLDKVGWNLKKAFKWSAHHIRYRFVGSSGAPSGAKMAEYYAKIGFSRLSGDCNVMAATFYYMAKLLGYKAYFMRGSVPLARGGWGPHAWVEVVKNGRTYLCDPDYEYDDGRNGYMITYSSGGWSYANRRRIC